MSDFQRYAVYYLPDDDAFATFGAAWLGWDVDRGEAVPHLAADVDLAAVTKTPRKYGFHGTLKPPFRLAKSTTPEGLFAAVEGFAASAASVEVDGLEIATVGSFLALVPTGGTDGLAELAGRIVTELDGFRALASEAELARRRAAGLTARQDELLLAWGYPYVLEEFRFHLTLSGRLDADGLAATKAEAERLLPQLPAPYHVRSIAVAGERADGAFQTIHRYALSG
ncbi:MAG: DUF1045 domain-containing protein [Pseudomonadota bacterium]